MGIISTFLVIQDIGIFLPDRIKPKMKLVYAISTSLLL